MTKIDFLQSIHIIYLIMNINRSYFLENKLISNYIYSIFININEYIIEKIHNVYFLIDKFNANFEHIPVYFLDEDVNDLEIRIRPNNGNSLFKIDFNKKLIREYLYLNKKLHSLWRNPIQRCQINIIITAIIKYICL